MNTLELSNGTKLNVQGIKPLLLQRIEREYKRKNEKPKKPTYKTEGLGPSEELDHDESTLTTTEDKKRWLKWKENDKEWTAGLNEKMLHAMILKGITNKFKITQDWIDEQEILGIDVPESKALRKILYFETELLSTPDDILQLSKSIMELSGLSPEVLAEADDLFQS